MSHESEKAEIPLVTIMSVSNVLKVKYNIGFYQRAYKWGDQQVNEMLTDFFVSFNSSYTRIAPKYGQNGRSGWVFPEASYYDLGGYSVETDGFLNYLVDGQQRLTTLSMIFSVLNKLTKDEKVQMSSGRSIAILGYPTKTLYQPEENGAEDDWTIDTPEFKAGIKNYLNSTKGTPNRLTECCRNIEKMLRQNFAYGMHTDDKDSDKASLLDGEKLAFFICWLRDRVFLSQRRIMQGTSSVVFENTNDRGLILTQDELLKGYLLREAAQEVVNNQAFKALENNQAFKALENTWAEIIANISKNRRTKGSQQNVIDTFFRTFLIGRYPDWEPGRNNNIPSLLSKERNSYYRWIKSNTNEEILDVIRPQTKRSAVDFINEIHFYSTWYKDLADETFIRRISEHNDEFQFMSMNTTALVQGRITQEIVVQLLFAVIEQTSNDTSLTPGNLEDENWRRIKLIGHLFEILSMRSAWEKKSQQNGQIQRLIPLFLGKETDEMALLAYTFLKENEAKEFNYEMPPKYTSSTGAKNHIRPLLRRLHDVFRASKNGEERFGIGSLKLINEYDIEHLLGKNDLDRVLFNSNDPNDEDFDYRRNDIGALILLPSDLNQSFGAAGTPLVRKVESYPDAFSSLLNPRYYDEDTTLETGNGKKAAKILLEHLKKIDSSFGLPPLNPQRFGVEQIRERTKSYSIIFKYLYDAERFLRLYSGVSLDDLTSTYQPSLIKYHRFLHHESEAMKPKPVHKDLAAFYAKYQEYADTDQKLQLLIKRPNTPQNVLLNSLGEIELNGITYQNPTDFGKSYLGLQKAPHANTLFIMYTDPSSGKTIPTESLDDFKKARISKVPTSDA